VGILVRMGGGRLGILRGLGEAAVGLWKMKLRLGVEGLNLGNFLLEGEIASSVEKRLSDRWEPISCYLPLLVPEQKLCTSVFSSVREHIPSSVEIAEVYSFTKFINRIGYHHQLRA
jgi:hypothetical protein